MTYRNHKVLAGTVLALALPATASQLPVSAATHRLAVAPKTAEHVPAPGLQKVALPGMTAPSYTVTLPTGDRVRLDAAGSGRYSISAEPGAAGAAISVTALGDSHAISALYAFPDNATALVRSGVVDRRLFDVRWLAAHGDTGPGGTLPVTVQFASSRPPAPPGATIVATTKSTRTFRVRAASAASFWAALAGHAGRGPALASAAMHPELAFGLVRAWAAGERPRTQAAASGQRTYTVTEDVTFTRAEIGGQSTLNIGVPLMSGVSGAGRDGLFWPTGGSCVDAACTHIQVTYDVPAGVYMMEDGSADFFADSHWRTIDIAIPQVKVGGNTEVSVNADTAVRFTVSTPRPAVPYESAFEGVRLFPDGQYEATITTVPYGSGFDQWAVPTTGVSICTYHSTVLWQLGAQPIAMTTDPQGRHALGVVYPAVNAVDFPFTRFSGTRSMRLADAGYGTAQDFGGQDVRGKLVLIRSAAAGMTINRDQMDNALNAGAAGVLAVAYPDQYGNSQVPFLPGWVYDSDPAPALPLAEIPASDASALVALLKQGPVRLLVTDTSSAEYRYSLAFTSQGQVPAAADYAVTDDQLEQVDTTYQDTQPGKVTVAAAVMRPDDPFATGLGIDETAPLTLHEYYGPSDPALAWFRSPLRYLTPYSYATVQGWDMFDRARSDPETWFDASEVPGAPTLSQDVMAGHPGLINAGSPLETLCSFCRLGDLFFPQFNMVSGQSPRLLDSYYQFDPGQTHLYLNGGELPQTQADGQLAYQLPPQQGQYRLTTAGGNLDTTWTFSSAHPARPGLADGYACYAARSDPADSCAAQPLIMLRYNAFADLNDAITAGGKHQIQITSYDQATAAPTDIASLEFWTSADGGATWQRAHVRHGQGGSFLADYSVPALGATNGRLSIRAQATDAAGNTISQTYYNDYALTSDPAPRS